jgi:serine-type D-Ala-D-Ala carboxypeptidase (penicillin-binding protein 5/6)
MRRSLWYGSVALIGVALCLCAAYILSDVHDTKLTPAATSSAHLPEFTGPLTTDTWGIFDPDSGVLLKGSNDTAVRPVASVAKLVTAAAVLASGQATASVTITPSDVAAEGRAGRLAVGDSRTLYQLLFPLLLESSNDAAAAIARVLGVSFDTAVRSLQHNAGMTQTVIADAAGASAGTVSNVHDLAAFFAYLRHSAPHVLDITVLRAYIAEKGAYYNVNPARSFDTFSGGKHGYTSEAGRTFIGTFALPGTDSEIGIVLLGSTNLTADITSLLSFGEALVASGILDAP